MVLVMGVVPVLPNKTTIGEVALVLVMVRFLLEVPLLEPSIVTLLLNTRINAALAREPVKVELTPLLGLISNV